MIGLNGVYDDRTQDVVTHCYEVGGFTTRSDFARENPEAVAAAAIQGFITTEVPGEGFGNTWRPSALGLDVLFVNGGRPSSLYAHGGVPDAFLQSIDGGRQREPAILN